MILCKLPKIPGDCMVKGYEEWITCSEFNFGIEREFADSAKGGTADVNLGVADLPPVELGKSMDKASALLFRQSISGKSLGTGEIHFVETMDDELFMYLQYKLDNVIVSKWDMTGSDDDRPTESFSLFYSKIWMEYTPFGGKKKGTPIKDGWDRILSKQWSQ